MCGSLLQDFLDCYHNHTTPPPPPPPPPSPAPPPTPNLDQGLSNRVESCVRQNGVAPAGTMPNAPNTAVDFRTVSPHTVEYLPARNPDGSCPSSTPLPGGRVGCTQVGEIGFATRTSSCPSGSDCKYKTYISIDEARKMASSTGTHPSALLTYIWTHEYLHHIPPFRGDSPSFDADVGAIYNAATHGCAATT